MAAPDHSLVGVYHFKMDPKSRVAIPADWRTNTKEKLRLMQSSSYGLPVLKVLMEEEYTDMFEDIESRINWTPRQRKMMRGRIYESCMEASVNAQNKLLVPKALCDEAGLLGGEAVHLVGRGTYYEMFSDENYRLMKKRQEEETKTLDEELGFF